MRTSTGASWTSRIWRPGAVFHLSIPGQILRDALLIPMGISNYELANAIKVPRSRANDILLGRRTITTDTAMRLGRYFGISPEFWINLQARRHRLHHRRGPQIRLHRCRQRALEDNAVIDAVTLPSNSKATFEA